MSPPALDETSVAFRRDFDAVQARRYHVPQRASYPRSRAALARRASDLEDLAHTLGGGDLLDELGERVTRDLSGDQAVDLRTRACAGKTRPQCLGQASPGHRHRLTARAAQSNVGGRFAIIEAMRAPTAAKWAARKLGAVPKSEHARLFTHSQVRLRAHSVVAGAGADRRRRESDALVHLPGDRIPVPARFLRKDRVRVRVGKLHALVGRAKQAGRVCRERTGVVAEGVAASGRAPRRDPRGDR